MSAKVINAAILCTIIDSLIALIFFYNTPATIAPGLISYKTIARD